VEAIEALYPDRLAQHTDRLAHHAYRGEVWAKAVEYLRRSGRRALFASATGQAVEIFERALGALRRLPQTPETLHKAIALRLHLVSRPGRQDSRSTRRGGGDRTEAR